MYSLKWWQIVCLFYSSVLIVIVQDLYCVRSGGQDECFICVTMIYLVVRSVGVVICTKIVSWLVWSETILHFYCYSVFCVNYSQYFCLVFLNISPLNPKKSSDFFSLFADFTVYIMKSSDFLNICIVNQTKCRWCIPCFRGQQWSVFVWLFHELCSWSVFVSPIYISHFVLYNCLSIQFIIQICSRILDILINPQNIHINPQISITFLQISGISLWISVKSMDLSKSEINPQYPIFNICNFCFSSDLCVQVSGAGFRSEEEKIQY